MMNDDRDFFLIFSMDCLANSLWPNFDDNLKAKVINFSRDVMGDVKSRKKFNIFSLFHAHISDENMLAQFIRYKERFRMGFFGGMGGNSFAKLIPLIKKFECLDFERKYKYQDEFIFLKINDFLGEADCRVSLGDSLLGSLNESITEWDDKLMSMYNKEYDLPLIEVVILKFKEFGDKEGLYSWRVALEPSEYEIARNLLTNEARESLDSVDFDDFDRMLLPN